MLDFFSEEMRRNPYPTYRQIRSAAPVFHDPRSDFWMIFDYEGAKRALTDPEAFSSRAAPPGGGALDWLIFFDPPRHTKLRALIARAFTPQSVANLEPLIRKLSSKLLDETIKSGEMDLVADYSLPLPMMVIAKILGIPDRDLPLFRRWNEVILNMIYTITGGEAAQQAVRDFGAATVEMGRYLATQLKERQANPGEDLLTRLLIAEVDGERLTDKDILSFFQLLLLAGSETTTNLISNAIVCLIENPDQLIRLRKAPELLPSAIEEILRYRSPLQAIFRQTKRDVEIHGQVIPAQKLVLAMIGSANRDPVQFCDADRFDIARDPNPHIAFGHGPHFCLGAPLARLEARIALADLLRRMQGIRFSSEKPWQPRQAFHVHGPSHLPIKFEPAGSPS
ncbi:MAG TPA: cytochrome P450 [Gemmataceae bacterium]|jgi:cytochrome P450|nr:cytochrome P450 [Gemmataceae bacterium]